MFFVNKLYKQALKFEMWFSCKQSFTESLASYKH